MKKCRQCGILSADTAMVCRSCNAKFTEEDKPIEITPIKKKKRFLSVLTIAIIFIAIATFALYQSGMLKTWAEASKKEEIKIITEDFVKADFEKDIDTLKSYMFSQYVEYHKKHNTISFTQEEYTSPYFFLYSQNVSIQVLSVDTEFLTADFDIYYNEINHKYNVNPTEIARVDVYVQITDGEITSTTTAPMTIIRLDKQWYILPMI